MDTTELRSEVASATRQAEQLRSGTHYREARVKFDQVAAEWRNDVLAAHNSQTINDEILDIERCSGEIRERRTPGKVVQRTRADCRCCGALLTHGGYLVERRGVQKFFPKRIEDEIPAACDSCGGNPWSSPASKTFGTIDFTPYYDVSLGKNAVCPPGVSYEPGKGHYIQTAGQLRDLGRLNGRDTR